jgi:hypothetical protein
MSFANSAGGIARRTRRRSASMFGFGSRANGLDASRLTPTNQLQNETAAVWNPTRERADRPAFASPASHSSKSSRRRSARVRQPSASASRSR